MRTQTFAGMELTFGTPEGRKEETTCLLDVLSVDVPVFKVHDARFVENVEGDFVG